MALEPRPDDVLEANPSWGEQQFFDPETNQPNVLEPTNELINVGYKFREYPSHNHFNWLFRLTNRWLRYLRDRQEQEKTTNGSGEGLFTDADALITLYAVDKATPANYIHAVGYKGATSAPVLTVLSNNVLTLGAGTVSGDQPISGGTVDNIIVFGKSKVVE